MKTIKAIKIVCILLSVLMIPHLDLKAHEAENAKLKISATLVLGRVSKNCQGLGICEFSLCIGTEPRARVSFSDDGKTLVTEVYEFATKGHEDLFSGPYFLMEEGVQIAPDLQKALGSSRPLIIKPGKYKLEKSREGFIIYFSI